MSQPAATSSASTGKPRTRRLLVLLVVLVAVVGLALVLLARATADRPAASATVRLADGRSLGQVDFFDADPGTVVRADLQVPAGTTSMGAFHGFHIHANDDPANGSGCAADADAAPETWFTAADGHLDDGGHVHGDHDGDLTSLYVGKDGHVTVDFWTDRVSPSELAGRAVVIHAGRDNFGNVPMGTGAKDYRPTGAEAKEATEKTGNAGDRVMCGVIELR
jgi:superoxide dismutase, Cu-Zn family